MDLQGTSLSWANDAMRKLEEEMRWASELDASVMLTGESGVGKQFAASRIHQWSRRRTAPFLAVHATEAIGVLPAALGKAAGAVTGGLLDAVEDGTLLMQDIETIPAPAQLQLLRFMDRSSTDKRQVRLMTATTTQLFSFVQAGEFRDDLFYRLNVIRFAIPPLRERPEDIPLMFDHYLSMDARAKTPQLSSAARRRLIEYSWPGNVRELRTVTRKLGSMSLPDVIEPEHLPCPIGGRS